MEQVMRRKLPIGMESFEAIRKEGFYYIDKTGMSEGLLAMGKVQGCCFKRGYLKHVFV